MYPSSPFLQILLWGNQKKKSPIKRKKAHKIENSAPYRAIAAMRKKPPPVAPNAELKKNIDLCLNTGSSGVLPRFSLALAEFCSNFH